MCSHLASVCISFERYDPLSKYPTVTWKAQQFTEKHRKLLDESDHVYKNQADDLVEWSFSNAVGPDAWAEIEPKLISISQQKVKLGVEDPNAEATGFWTHSLFAVLSNEWCLTSVILCYRRTFKDGLVIWFEPTSLACARKRTLPERRGKNTVGVKTIPVLHVNNYRSERGFFNFKFWTDSLTFRNTHKIVATS